MEFREVERAIDKTAQQYFEKYKIQCDADFVLHKLYEEMGELTEAYLTYNQKSRPEKFLNEKDAKKKLSYELADVVGMAMLFAKEMNIDLEDAINRKWIVKEWKKKKL